MADDYAGKLVKPKKTDPNAGGMDVDENVEYLPTSFDDGLSYNECVCGDCDRAFPDANSSNSGLYELQAVLTHKGASSNSGHYVAWVRQSSGSLRSLPLIIRLGVTGRDRLAAL